MRTTAFGSEFVAAGLLVTAMSTILFAQATQSKSGDASAGEQLFTGRRPLQNGGPPCAICHSIAGIPFPNGGSLGPELTGTYPKFGPEGVNTMLQTLYFPTMLPLFQDHPLTLQEQSDLKAFFQSAASLPPAPDYTLVFGLIALGGLAVLLAAIAVIWHHRLQAVREPLVESAIGERS